MLIWIPYSPRRVPRRANICYLILMRIYLTQVVIYRKKAPFASTHTVSEGFSMSQIVFTKPFRIAWYCLCLLVASDDGINSTPPQRSLLWFFPFTLRIKQFAALLSLARVEPFNEVSNSVGSKRDKRVINSGILTLLDEMRGAKRVYGRILLFSSKIHHGWARLQNINNFWGFECFRKGFFLIKALWDDPLWKSLMEDLWRANQWRDLRFAVIGMRNKQLFCFFRPPLKNHMRSRKHSFDCWICFFLLFPSRYHFSYHLMWFRWLWYRCSTSACSRACGAERPRAEKLRQNPGINFSFLLLLRQRIS